MLTISPLVLHRDLVPLLSSWFVEAWPEWYGPGGPGNAVADLTAFALSASTLPLGLIAFEESSPVGVAALKSESLPTHRHLTPWAAAGLVLSGHRGRGIGASLLGAVVRQAGKLGYQRVYCGTATAASLLRRSGWSELEVIQHDGETLVVFAKETAQHALAADAPPAARRSSAAVELYAERGNVMGTQQPVSVTTLKAIAGAFNAHDLDAIMEFFAEDCSLDMPRGPEPWGQRFTGKVAVREALASRFKGLPDVHYGDDRHWVSGDLGVSEWLLTGTTSEGRAVKVRGCDHWEFRDGKVTRKDSYWKIVERPA